VKAIRVLAVALAGWAIWSASPIGMGKVTEDRASTAPSTASAPSAPDLDALRGKAFQRLLDGEFREGLKLLAGPAGRRAGPSAHAARDLTEAYLKRRARFDAERAAERAAAEMRVRLAGLAEKHRPELLKVDPDEKIYAALEEVSDAVISANAVLEVRPSTRPADLRQRAEKEIARATEALRKVTRLAGEAPEEWRRAFETSAEELRRALSDLKDAWAKASLPEDWRRLTLAGERVQDALIDMGVLAAREPIMVALAHARQAKDLAEDGQAFLKRRWVRDLVGKAEAHGRELLAEGEWAEVLSLYGSAGLGGLNEDDASYQDIQDRAARHVRAITLYGDGNGAPTTRPTTAPSTRPSEAPRWREMITGIDTAMVRNAVTQIGNNYVEQPDYRKLAVAALQGVKIVVQTPEAAAGLPALRDDDRRKAFLDGLDDLTEQVREAPTVDGLEVQRVLNVLHDLNDAALGLPSEVLDMEFAEAMLADLDRFTGVIWPQEMDDFQKRTMGSFCGIGVQIRKGVGQPIEVVTPLADTPAFKAGIRAGDEILKVEEADTRRMGLDRAVKLITGPENTNVTLTIRRAGVSKPFRVVITRARIHIQTVKGWRRLADGKWDFLLDPRRRIGYVRLTQFTQDTVGELRQALRELREGGARGVILDMRLNPGGLLTAAVDVADEFLRRGLIVRTEGLKVRESVRNARGAGEYQSGQVVVLVNQFSASASEIAAGALKDWGRATVVGVRTYGKGSVQRLIPLRPSGRAKLKLTTAYYYLPSGRCLHRTNGAKQWGVDPHVPVPITGRQRNRRAEIQQETDLLKAVDPELLETLLAQELREDIQLQTALLLMRLKLLAREG